MTLLAQLETQVARVRRHRDREKLQGLDQEAGPAQRSVGQVLAEWQRLKSLATIAPELTGGLSEQLEPLRERLVTICRDWDALGGRISLPNVTALQRSLSEAQGIFREVRLEATKVTEAALVPIEREIANTEFLVGELALTATSIREASAGMRTQIAGVREVLGGKRAVAPPGWAQIRALFNTEASPRACLRLAHLPEGTAAIVGQLLMRGELPLADCSPEDLAGLLASPALARLCRLTLLKGSSS